MREPVGQGLASLGSIGQVDADRSDYPDDSNRIWSQWSRRWAQLGTIDERDDSLRPRDLLYFQY